MTDENTESAEGGNEKTAIDFNDPLIQKHIKKQIDDAVGGLKSKNEQLLKKLHDYKDDRFDGIDPGKLKAMLDKFEDEAERAALKEGRIDDVVKGRVENINRQLAAKDTALTELQKA